MPLVALRMSAQAMDDSLKKIAELKMRLAELDRERATVLGADCTASMRPNVRS
jgi:hypothetical protein